MQQSFNTPMMKQYVAIKKQYEDCLLFYRMGDFYELFLDDALTGSRVLNITLTSRAKGKDGRIPMAGVPYHAVDAYLTKLVKAGYKVAICEQVSLPSKTGIIDRQVVRIVTPGTVLDEKALDKKDNNYIISMQVSGKRVGIAISDISTGYFEALELESNQLEQTIKDELARLHPSECILPESLYNDPAFLSVLKAERGLNIFPFLEWDTFADDAATVLKKHFTVSTLASFGLADKKIALQTAAVLLGYLKQTQKGPVNHIKKIAHARHDECLVLDRSTILNLELFSTIREHDTKASLLWALDQTTTAMGGRLLKQWMRKPLATKESVQARHDAVSVLLASRDKRTLIRTKLEEVSDIERLLSRLSVGLGNGRDIVNLKNSLRSVLEIKKLMEVIDSSLIKSLSQDIKKEIKEIIALVEKKFTPEPPISIREGGIIAEGVDKELDRLRKIVGGSRDWLLDLEKDERERTGIASLKIRFNQVFGFYIEVSKSNLHLVPADYMRKQTLVNGERFITPELKKQEEIILTAEQKINDIEYHLFREVLEQVLDSTRLIQDAAESIAALDCLANFATIAEKNDYVRPELLDSSEINITNGRHPVVEKLLAEKEFVPNDVSLNSDQQMLLITGPNMAGKSVFIRQVALIVLMSQMGSFVPAEKAEMGIVDRIFVRSGASDVITSGLSTFMVEMVETAYILHYATEKSLIVMDEIGRGTSTYDGISIAWAVAEYLVTHLSVPPKTLFATHYHELQSLEEQYPGIRNYHMSVAREKDAPIFLHTIEEGGASHSFGVAVAKLAGIPDPVIVRANEMLEQLEKRSSTQSSSWLVKDRSDERSIKNDRDSGFGQNDENHLLVSELAELDIHHMTPIEALNKLSELKDKLKLFTLQQRD